MKSMNRAVLAALIVVIAWLKANFRVVEEYATNRELALEYPQVWSIFPQPPKRPRSHETG